MKKLLFLLLIFLSACGRVKETPDWPIIPDELAGYLVDYLEDAKSYNQVPSSDWLGSGVVEFYYSTGRDAGLCEMNVALDANGNRTQDGSWTVYVNSYQWDKFSDEEKNVLMYHEFGHCLNGFGHRNETTEGVPDSIMYPYVFGEGFFNDYRYEYIYELFNNSWPY